MCNAKVVPESFFEDIAPPIQEVEPSPSPNQTTPLPPSAKQYTAAKHEVKIKPIQGNPEAVNQLSVNEWKKVRKAAKLLQFKTKQPNLITRVLDKQDGSTDERQMAKRFCVYVTSTEYEALMKFLLLYKGSQQKTFSFLGSEAPLANTALKKIYGN